MSVEVRVVVDKAEKAMRVIKHMQAAKSTGKITLHIDNGYVVVLEVTERM